MKPAVYSPIYCALYPDLAEIARSHGYALAVHDSLARDFDLICVPWIAEPSEPQAVINEITSTFNIRHTGKREVKEHDRETFVISIGHGECFIDLSFMPRVRLKEKSE